MAEEITKRCAVVLALLAALVLLSASRNDLVRVEATYESTATNGDGNALLDITLPFETHRYCRVNGEEQVVAVHRRIRLFFLPAPPRLEPPEVSKAEVCK